MAEKKSKLESRKFIVWLTQAIMSFLVFAMCFVIIGTAKPTAELLTALIRIAESAMGYFTLISGVYLGVNLGQKLGLAFSGSKTEEKETE